jgi:hypothetical protein
MSSTRLDLETTRPSASTGALELAALALDVWLLGGVGTEAEMLEGLTGVLGSTEEDGVGSGGETGGNLVDGEALTTSLLDAGAGGGGEAHSRNGELGDLKHAVVVGDGADLILISPCISYCFRGSYNDNGLALVGLRGVLVGSGRDNLGQRDGCGVLVNLFSVLRVFGRLTRAVHLGHHETSEDDLVEGGIGTACPLLAPKCAKSDRITYGPGTCTDAPTA